MRTESLVLAMLVVAIVGQVHAVAAAETLASLQQKMIDSSGGEEAWSRIGALRLTGVRNRNGYEMGLVAWLARPHRVRVEHTLRGRREIFVWNGERGWLAGFGDAETFRPLAAGESGERLGEVQKYLRWPEVWELFESAKLDGLEQREGGALQRLLLVPRNGEAETWLVDRGSGRVVEIIEPTVGEEGERYEVHSFAWDYRRVGEIVLPFYIEMDHGTALFSIEVESIEIDPPFEDSLFAAPGLPEPSGGDALGTSGPPP